MLYSVRSIKTESKRFCCLIINETATLKRKRRFIYQANVFPQDIPNEYDMYWPTPSSIVSYVPSCLVGDSIFGYVRATLKDGYNNSIVVDAPLWNYYVTMVHTAPNPCNTILTVSLGGPANEMNGRSRLTCEPIVVSLHDDHGLVRSVEADSSQPEIKIDVSDLPNGFYYLNILKGGELIDRQVVLVKH